MMPETKMSYFGNMESFRKTRVLKIMTRIVKVLEKPLKAIES